MLLAACRLIDQLRKQSHTEALSQLASRLDYNGYYSHAHARAARSEGAAAHAPALQAA